jgi:thioesterase domain-containing protein
MSQRLPSHMVPSRFIELSEMPLLGNGKIDRKALSRIAVRVERAETAEDTFLDSTHLQLIQIWQKILGHQEIRLNDNFFELGGNSLLAVNLCAQLGKIYGKKISVRTVFDVPTIGLMAAFIRQKVSLTPPSSITPINPNGSNPPFFCVHAAGGVAHSYISLARCLGPEQPFFALQSRGLDIGQQPLKTVEEMADLYSKDILNVEPDGPYYLGGWSFGVPVSFEIARQLTHQGKQVQLLVLMDSPRNQNPVDDFLNEEELFAAEQSYLAQYLMDKLELTIENLSFDQQVLLYLNHLKESGILPLDITPDQLQRFIRVTVLNKHAARMYRAKPYTGRITLFRSASSSHTDYYYGWKEVALGGIDVFTFDADHENFISGSNALPLAQQLCACLKEAAR